jgi:hypothetical protein
MRTGAATNRQPGASAVGAGHAEFRLARGSVFRGAPGGVVQHRAVVWVNETEHLVDTTIARTAPRAKDAGVVTPADRPVSQIPVPRDHLAGAESKPQPLVALVERSFRAAALLRTLAKQRRGLFHRRGHGVHLHDAGRDRSRRLAAPQCARRSRQLGHRGGDAAPQQERQRHGEAAEHEPETDEAAERASRGGRQVIGRDHDGHRPAGERRTAVRHESLDAIQRAAAEGALGRRVEPLHQLGSDLASDEQIGTSRARQHVAAAIQDRPEPVVELLRL